MKISLLHATYHSGERALWVKRAWARARADHDLEHIFAMDADDTETIAATEGELRVISPALGGGGHGCPQLECGSNRIDRRRSPCYSRRPHARGKLGDRGGTPNPGLGPTKTRLRRQTERLRRPLRHSHATSPGFPGVLHATRSLRRRLPWPVLRSGHFDSGILESDDPGRPLHRSLAQPARRNVPTIRVSVAPADQQCRRVGIRQQRLCATLASPLSDGSPLSP